MSGYFHRCFSAAFLSIRFKRFQDFASAFDLWKAYSTMQLDPHSLAVVAVASVARSFIDVVIDVAGLLYRWER